MGRLKKGKMDPASSAISVRKEGPVNWRSAIRDFLITLSGSRSVATAPDDPGPRRPSYPGAYCGAEPPYILRHFHEAAGAGVRKQGGEIVALSRPTRPERGPFMRRGVARYFRGAQEGRGQPQPRQTTLFQCHNRGQRRPISDTKDLGIITSKGSMGEIALYGLGRRLPHLAYAIARRA